MARRLLWLIISLLGAGLFLGACAGISRQSRSQVTFNGPFSELQQRPDDLIDDVVLLGGRIIETRPLEKGSEIEILQLDLDSWNRPQDNGISHGRFLIIASQFIDPVLYPKGTLIALTGKVTGSVVRHIGRMSYRYPMIAPTEIKIWRPDIYPVFPRFQFGIGIGTTF